MKKYYLLFLYVGFFFTLSGFIYKIQSNNDAMFMVRIYISVISFSIGYIGYLLENFIEIYKNKK